MSEESRTYRPIPEAAELIERAAEVLSEAKDPELANDYRRWLKREYRRRQRPIRALMTSHVIRELHVDRWHGVEVEVQPASSKNLVCMSRAKADEKRQELALKYVKSAGGGGRRVAAACYLAICVALDVDKANANEIVVELSKAAVEFIRTRFDLRLRTVATSTSKLVVTGPLKALAALEKEIRGIFFTVTTSEQRLLLTAQRALAEAVGLEADEGAGDGRRLPDAT